MKTKRIGIDASGGDHGLSEVVPGAIKASETSSCEIVVYGNLETIAQCIPEGKSFGNIRTVQCDRPNDELESAFLDLVKGNLSAIITASGSRRLLNQAIKYRQEGIPRPCLIAPYPIGDKTVYMLDVGATARVSNPEVFLGWAKVGYDFLKLDLGIEEPKIGLLNNSDKRGAYPELVKIHQTLQIHKGYVGYAEPARFFKGEIDLWLMEGFIGNAFLKLIEEILPLALSFCHQELADMPLAQLHLANMVKKKLSYDAYLVSPLLGVKGKVFRVHGKCNHEQIARSFRAIEQYL